MMDEMLRAVQKPTGFDESSPEKKYSLFGHVDIHRFLKDMVKSECESARSGVEGVKELPYSKQIAKILLKNFDDAIKTRACFILLALVENAETSALVMPQLKKQIMAITAEFKASGSKSKGL